MQKRAVRIILKMQWIESVKRHFPKLGIGIVTVYRLYVIELILYVKNDSENLCKFHWILDICTVLEIKKKFPLNLIIYVFLGKP